MGRSRRDNDRGIDQRKKIPVPAGEMRFRNSCLKGLLQPMRVVLGHEQLDWQRAKIAQMVESPAAEAKQQYFCHPPDSGENVRVSKLFLAREVSNTRGLKNLRTQKSLNKVLASHGRFRQTLGCSAVRGD